MLKNQINKLAALCDPTFSNDECYAETLVKAAGLFPFWEIEKYFKDHPPSPRVIYLLMVKAQEAARVERAKKGGDSKAALLKEPKEAIRQAWAGGNYSSRDICVQEEWQGLGFGSDKAARNALTNSLDPDPWPAKKQKKKKKLSTPY